MAPFYTPVFRGLVPFGLFSFLFSSVAYTRRPIGTGRISSTPMSRPSGPFLVRCCGDTTQSSATSTPLARQPGPRASPYCLSRHCLLPPQSVVQVHLILNCTSKLREGKKIHRRVYSEDLGCQGQAITKKNAKYGRDGQFLDRIHTDKEMIRK